MSPTDPDTRSDSYREAAAGDYLERSERLAAEQQPEVLDRIGLGWADQVPPPACDWDAWRHGEYTFEQIGGRSDE